MMPLPRRHLLGLAAGLGLGAAGLPAQALPPRTLVFPRDHGSRSEEHTSELQSQSNLVCRLLLEKKKKLEAPPARDQEERRLASHAVPCDQFVELRTAKDYHHEDLDGHRFAAPCDGASTWSVAST